MSSVLIQVDLKAAPVVHFLGKKKLEQGAGSDVNTSIFNDG